MDEREDEVGGADLIAGLVAMIVGVTAIIGLISQAWFVLSHLLF